MRAASAEHGACGRRPRVRVARAEMEKGMVIKEMSEATILEKLDKELAKFDR